MNEVDTPPPQKKSKAPTQASSFGVVLKKSHVPPKRLALHLFENPLHAPDSEKGFWFCSALSFTASICFNSHYRCSEHLLKKSWHLQLYSYFEKINFHKRAKFSVLMFRREVAQQPLHITLSDRPPVHLYPLIKLIKFLNFEKETLFTWICTPGTDVDTEVKPRKTNKSRCRGRSGLRFRIRIQSDPVFLHGSGSGSGFQISLDPDPGSVSAQILKQKKWQKGL